MPVQGTSTIPASLKRPAPQVELSNLTSANLELESAEVLQLLMEVDDRSFLELLPPAQRPTIPPMATRIFWRWKQRTPDEVTLAQVRVMARAGVRSRGLLLASYFSGPDAARAELQSGWAFDARDGLVKLRRFHDRIVGEVDVDGRTILRAELKDPGIASPEDVEHTVNLNIARVDGASDDAVRLVQVEPEYRVEQAFRGRPLVTTFSQEAWDAEGLSLTHPILALYYQGGFRLPSVRYLIDPNETIGKGMEL